jgi:hypothetical protein
MKYDMKQLIQGEVTFEFYRDGNLYYRTGDGALLFPVPISDVGNATFKMKDKGILFMRYIRKFLDVCKESE